MACRIARLAVVVALVSAAPAAAQRAGAVELGAFALYTNFDNSLGMSTSMGAVGAGGWAAVYLRSGLAFELDLSRTSSDGAAGSGATYTPVHARLVGGLGSGGRVEALLGGGYVRNAYGGSLNASDGGFSGLVGMRYQLNNRVWLRMGVDFDIMFHPSRDSRFSFYNGNWGLHVGVGTRLNGAGGGGGS